MLSSGLIVLTLVGALLSQDTGRDAAIGLARAALARQLQTDVSAAAVSEVRDVDWPDSGLGCAAAGEMSAPVITPGHLVRFRFAEKDYEVRIGSGRARICGGGSGSAAAAPPTPADDQSTSEAERGLKMAQRAREALASRLSVAIDRVTIVSYTATTWPNAALGCTDRAALFPPSPTRGFLIQLEAESRRYEYHSDNTRVVQCAVKP